MTVPIRCDSVRKQYHKLVALEDVSFTVEKPKVVGLAGPNGSGKSTLLRILVGANKPTDGRIQLYGRTPKETRTKHYEVGFLSADERMFPDLTVMENMVYRGLLQRLTKSQCLTESSKLLRSRNLYDLRDRFPDTLSTGQKRQVVLLSTLLHSPRILMLDEPTTGIDIEAVSSIYSLLADLSDRDTTIILATHSIEELVSLSTHTLVLTDGQLVFDGRTDALGSNAIEARKSLLRLFGGDQLETDVLCFDHTDVEISPAKVANT